MGDKKGQAAMEFLMTYGWALLVVLVSLGSLTFYFGYDNSSFASETCFFGPGLGCSDMLVNEDSISLKVMNSLGKDMTSFSVSSTNCDVPSDNPRLDNGDEAFLTLSGCSFTPEDLIDESLSLTYTFIDSSLEHIKDATLTAVVEGGTTQSFGGGSGSGGGYSSDGSTIVLYKFDEGDGGLVTDSSSNGLHGSFNTIGELIDNGGAETSNLDNFDGQYNFQGIRTSGCKTGSYCFYRDGAVAHVRSNELIEIDFTKSYTLNGDFKSTGAGESKLYFGYIPYDENYVRINSQEVNVITSANTETTLFEDVSPGDTVIKITDGSNWVIESSIYVAFDVDDSGSYNDLPNRRISSKILDIQDMGLYWELTLDALANEDFPAGTKVREHKGAGSYMYEAFDTGPPDNVPFSWKNFNGVTFGENLNTADYGGWWRGTKYVQLLMLPSWSQGATYSLDVDDLSVVTDPITYTNKWAAGKFGTVIEFNGVDDYVKIPYNEDMLVTDQFTLEFWLNPLDFFEGVQRIAARSASWAATLNNGVISFHTNVGATPVTITYPLPNPNQWYHIAGTYDGANMYLFVDGVEVSNTAQTGNLNPKAGTGLFIGSNSGTGQFLKSLVDEIRVSDYVRYT